MSCNDRFDSARPVCASPLMQDIIPHRSPAYYVYHMLIWGKMFLKLNYDEKVCFSPFEYREATSQKLVKMLQQNDVDIDDVLSPFDSTKIDK